MVGVGWVVLLAQPAFFPSAIFLLKITGEGRTPPGPMARAADDFSIDSFRKSKIFNQVWIFSASAEFSVNLSTP